MGAGVLHAFYSRTSNSGHNKKEVGRTFRSRTPAQYLSKWLRPWLSCTGFQCMTQWLRRCLTCFLQSHVFLQQRPQQKRVWADLQKSDSSSVLIQVASPMVNLYR